MDDSVKSLVYETPLGKVITINVEHTNDYINYLLDKLNSSSKIIFSTKYGVL